MVLNNRVESAAFVITLANGQTFKSSWMRTIGQRSHPTTLVHKELWDVKELAHYLQRVGHGVPGVVTGLVFALLTTAINLHERRVGCNGK